MQPNPALKQLGFSADDRVVIIHADDIGMCQASLSAYADLVDFGLLSSASVMVPCAWFPSVAAYCRQHPQADMGVHLTITSEWDSYRWAPISTADPASGLIDPEGYFYRTSRDAQQHGDPAAVAREIEAQIDRAVQAGIDPTHLDTHMGTVAHPAYLPAYTQAALTRRLPAMALRWDAETYRRERGMDDEAARATAQAARQLDELGIPLLDAIAGMPLHGDKPLELAQQILGGLRPGLTHFIMHPSQDTPELRAIAPDWRARVADYELFTSEALRAFIRDQGIQVIGYRPLRDLLRG